MRDLTPSWRWFPATLLALLLLLLLATGAARFYPRGVLGVPADPWARARCLIVLPDLTVVPDVPADVPEPEPRRPEPEPDVFRPLWTDWIAARALEIVSDDAPAPPPAPLVLPTLDWRALARTEPDTSVLGRLARTMLLRDGLWEDHKIWAIMDMYGLKAARYQALKASVFNENWLEKEHLD